jgi:hypothetical protein
MAGKLGRGMLGNRSELSTALIQERELKRSQSPADHRLVLDQVLRIHWHEIALMRPAR